MNEYDQQLETKKSRVLVENNAQSIFDHLTELVNLGGIHERRWLWELLQNAKDSVDESQKVSVKVQFTDNHLIFQHNGTPFTDDEIIHLIYHGSTKKGSVDKTGKFGTGFLTTHLLSKKVLVSGILKDGRGFNFTLDRSGKTSKEIESAMESSWEAFKISQVESQHNTFTTSYSYTLDGQSKTVAEKGLYDLPRLLPFVLAFNSKFESFALKTPEADENFYRFSTQSIDHNGNDIDIVTIESKNQNSQTSRFILAIARKDRTAVAVPLVNAAESMKVVSIESDLPRLFFDFPLFGTEEFSFPAVINSSEFFPKSERDGVYLGDNTGEDIQRNKGIIGQACALYLGLVDYACSAQWENLHKFAFLAPPNHKDWLDSKWYIQTLQSVLAEIIQKRIVETKDTGYISPKDALIPVDSPIAELWEIAFPMFPTKLPAKVHINDWWNILKSWGTLLHKNPEDFENSLTFLKLCNELSQFGTLENLAIAFQPTDQPDGVAWLNNLFRHLFLQDKRFLFEAYAIIPNQNAVFKKKTPGLFLDTDIDDAIKDISKAIGDDWRDRLVLIDLSQPSWEANKGGA